MVDFAKNDRLENMENIESEIMNNVLDAMGNYDYTKYDAHDVQYALDKRDVGIDEFAALLSPAALPFIEQMARRAMCETHRQFGNSVSLFTPLYISNYCVNNCVYCGFNCKNKINRGKLTLEEIEKEMQAISKTGLKEILILTGESRVKSDVEYIGEAVKIAKKYFSTIGIEVYPMNIREYEYIQKCGADFVSVYQETYNREKYKNVHLSGPKSVFEYRFNAQERALRAGMRGVSMGALLGLDDFRKDAFAAGLQAYYLQRKYPHAEIAFSVPRLRPYINREETNPKDVHETQLLQVMLAFRIFLPFAGITISTRERAGFRDNVVGMCATKISAGVEVGVGGHEGDSKGDEQFEISDPRSVEEVRAMLQSKGLQEVFTDYIRV